MTRQAPGSVLSPTHKWKVPKTCHSEEALSHVDWDNNHSGLMVILDGTQRERDRKAEREKDFWETDRLSRALPPLSSPSVFPSVNSCGYLSLAYTPPSRVTPAVLEWLTSDKEEIGVEHRAAKFRTRMNDKSTSLKTETWALSIAHWRLQENVWNYGKEQDWVTYKPIMSSMAATIFLLGLCQVLWDWLFN